jgi:hypothetical protein
MNTMRNRIVATVVAVASLTLVGCSSSPTPEATDAGVDLAATTTIAATLPTAPEITTTIPVETTVPAVPSTVAPVTTAPKAPSTAPKTPTATQVPQLQLTGTPQEQANQVVSAVAEVASISGNFKTWSSKLHQLNQSVASYGIKVVWDPNDVGKDIYQISMGSQSACFLWTYKDAGTSTAKYLQPHSCS